METLAYEIGEQVARRGGILFSGGRDGVMAAASRGAHEAGGITVGSLPGRPATYDLRSRPILYCFAS